MSDFTRPAKLPPEQQAIRAKCFHPSGMFVEFPREEVEKSIPERFEKIVWLHPDRVAVKTANYFVTYAELNRAANRVTRAVLAQQRNLAEPVALLFEKGIEQIVAMVGVLKAGGFFLLLDPSFPRARIAHILKDSVARLLIHHKQTARVASELQSNDCKTINFDSINYGEADEQLRKNISPRDLASIVYTSGSSGQPKGVIQSHQNLLHRVMLFTGQYHICPYDRVSLLSFGTSNSVTHSLFALLNGATLLLYDVKTDGVAGLADWMLREEISLCLISSPLFRHLCDTLPGKNRLPNLRLIGLRSDKVYKTDFDLYKKYFSTNCVFSTSLASTESGNLSIYFADQDTEIAGEEVPVGYPVADKDIALVDDDGTDVGFNQVGEIVVKSKYLSPGYWRKPELTRDKFAVDPHNPELRVYHTGDLGLMRFDGCLMHRGRKDFRVKIRGYGVDLGEVEKNIHDHPAVGEAVVLDRGESGETRLLAYFTSPREPDLTVGELRRFLVDRLSDYMIPSAFVRLEKMPLTSNGKVDRKALPDERGLRPELEVAYFAPRTSIEKKLTSIWAEVLHLHGIGIRDNFFDLGGDSLSASRVVSQIAKRFHIDLTLIHFFERPTIEAHAALIEKTRQKEPGAQDVFIKRIPSDARIPLSFAQERLWFLDQLEPGSCAYNVFFAYQLTGDLNVLALEQSVNEIIKRHEVLRTVFAQVNGEPIQSIVPSLTLKIPVIDLRKVISGEERQSEAWRLAKEEAQRPFDLARGPLLRMMLLRLADDEYILLRSMHHIVSDAWSGGVLFRELAALYEAFSNGQPSPLRELPIQYADYAVWQRQWLRGEILESQLSYWRKQLQDIQTLQLPADGPRGALQSSRGARQYFKLSGTLSSELKRLSRRQGVTIFMTLLAAFQTLLSRYSGQTDIVIGSPVAGRSRGESESLIGFFLNMLVLRSDLSGDPTFVETMNRVKDVCLGALSHQELPFEKLVEELNPVRDLSQNPLFQVAFAFQNTPRFVPQLSRIRVNEVEVETGIARFDLHCFMEEEDGYLKGAFDYNTDLFNADSIKRLIGHFEILLEGIVINPHQRISELPLLTDAEKQLVSLDWNDTRRDYPKDVVIHELFEEQVERTPDAIAVVLEDQQLTYRELNCRANRLAHYLRKLGVGPETLVAICMAVVGDGGWTTWHSQGRRGVCPPRPQLS
jgi:amino acid adenylation domain-containing protein